MIITVECPHCHSTFPVDPAKVPAGGVKVRCSNCSGIFRVEKPPETVPAAAAPTPAPPEPPAVAETPAAPAAEEPGADEPFADAEGAPSEPAAEEAPDEETAHGGSASIHDTPSAVEAPSAHEEHEPEEPGRPDGGWAPGDDFDEGDPFPGVMREATIEEELPAPSFGGPEAEAPEDEPGEHPAPEESDVPPPPPSARDDELAGPSEPDFTDPFDERPSGEADDAGERGHQDASLEDRTTTGGDASDSGWADGATDWGAEFEAPAAEADAPEVGGADGATGWGAEFEAPAAEADAPEVGGSDGATGWGAEFEAPAAEADAPEAGEAAEEPDPEDWVFETQEELDPDSVDVEPLDTVEEQMRSASEAIFDREQGVGPAGGGSDVPSAPAPPADDAFVPAAEAPVDAPFESPPAAPRPAVEESEPEAEDPTPVAPPGFQFGRRDPREKAKRLARVLVSDIITYNPERHARALENDSLAEDFDDEIRKSWAEYVDQVGRDIAEETPYFTQALNDILARGRKVFGG